jgi:hypothetical protein
MREIPMPPIVWGQANLAAAAAKPQPWLWHGYLTPGAVTLLTGQWKAGKTTLASVLVSRLQAGGELAGSPLAAGRAVVVSEEPLSLWQRRSQHLSFGDHVGWFCQPFHGRPTPDHWESLLATLAVMGEDGPLDLVVIDSLAAFLPAGAENSAAAMLAALAPMRWLTERQLSVLVLHHPAKGAAAVGQLARGSGALSAAADILLELRLYPKAAVTDRRRWLEGLSRFPETPRQRVIELTADGTDYVSRGTLFEEEFAAHWQMLQRLLAGAGKQDRQEILERWPGEDPPEPRSLSRWLERAVDLGLLRRDGRGQKGSPYRYWLPECEETWQQEPQAAGFLPELCQTPVVPPGAVPSATENTP